MPKTKLSIWVDESTASKLKRLATTERLTVSEFGGLLLTRGLTAHADGIVMDAAGARLERAVRQEIASMSDRLAGLTVRAALEAGAGRLMLYTTLAEQLGDDAARELERDSWSAARDRLRRPSQSVQELLSSAVGGGS